MSTLELKVVSTETLSADNVREVCEGSDGKKYERLIQKIDKKTGMLASRSRSLQPEVVENIVIREILVQEPQKDTRNPSSSLTDEERKAVVDAKIQSIQDRKEKQDADIKFHQLDEDDEAAEEKKSTEQREAEKLLIERNQQAAKNVTEVRDLQESLKSQGKSKLEIKAAVKELKEAQKRGRPSNASLKNPVKDPITGEFVEDAGE